VSGGFADVYIDLDGSLATTDDRIQILDEAFNLSIKHALRRACRSPSFRTELTPQRDAGRPWTTPSSARRSQGLPPEGREASLPPSPSNS